jgi:toxin ParE1/3/4
MQVVLSRFIENDLDAIAEYIRQANAARAVSFIQEIRSKFRAIGQNPLLYRLRPEIGEDARVAIVGRYVILFRISDQTISSQSPRDQTVRIERVVYGGRDLVTLFDPLIGE